MDKNIIGIIGGMGPQASAEFYRMLIMQARVHYGAHENSDYPELLIDSVPVPDFLSDTKQMEKASLMSEDRVKRLTMYGVSTITIACNTACILIKRLQKSTCVSIVSVVEEVVKEVEKDNRKILLLASPTSLQAGLYQSAFKQHGISYVVPTTKELKELECIIRGIIDNENKAEDDAEGIATDSLINYETVKYFTNENYENTRYIEKLNDWVKKGKKAWKYGPLIFGGQETIFILGSIFILYLAVLNVINNIFTVGDIVLVGAYLSNMTGLMNGLSYAYRNIKKSITDKKEIIKILKEDSEIKEIENPKVLGKVKGEILYKNVSFAYHNQNIIKDFNLKIKAGEKVAFVGSSGGGKSTLIVQLLPRFYDIQKGQK